ncbi:MAG TPA: hypothetical protein VM580_17925, partial [Labilithrix sp.]|nr:hypothetical protein [Labilithrix sp.]
RRGPYSHACWVHTPSGGVQIPQLALQQTMPGSHITFPHTTPPPEGAKGMQTALPSWDSQRELVMHSVAAHGCVPVTHVGMGGQGARTQTTVLRSQYASSGHFVSAHPSASGVGLSPPPGCSFPWVGAGARAPEPDVAAAGGALPVVDGSPAPVTGTSPADAGDAAAFTSRGGSVGEARPHAMATPPTSVTTTTGKSIRSMPKS